MTYPALEVSAVLSNKGEAPAKAIFHVSHRMAWDWTLAPESSRRALALYSGYGSGSIADTWAYRVVSRSPVCFPLVLFCWSVS